MSTFLDIVIGFGIGLALAAAVIYLIESFLS